MIKGKQSSKERSKGGQPFYRSLLAVADQRDHAAVAWVVYTDIIARDKNSLAAWAQCIEEFQERFIIGSDKVGHWGTYGAEISKYDSLLDLLKPGTAQN